jgi:protein-disulfide isomerase
MVLRHECPQKEPAIAAERPTTLSQDTVGPDRRGGHRGSRAPGCPEPVRRSPGEAASGKDVGELYSGIPQNGTTLGKSTAPVTIYLYEDFQCPVCGQFSRKTFPEVVDRSVRGGKVKVVSEPLTFIGSDSVPAARAALAAGEQDRYWPYAQLLFENQGEENSGYVTDGFLKSQAENTPGLDVGEWSSDLKGSSVTKQLQAAQSKAQSAGVNATPTLIFSGPGGQTKLVGLYDYEQVSQAIAQVD